MHRLFGVFVNFFWAMDLLLEISMCVWFKLIYFAIGTLCDLNWFTLLLELWVCLWWILFLLILIFLGFVALWYYFFPCIGIPLCLVDHWENRSWIILSYMYLYLQSTLKSIFITYVAAWHHLIVFVLIVTFVLIRGYFFMLMLVVKTKEW